MIFGGVALGVAAVAIVVSVAASGGGDGERQCDEAGLCVTLPDGWTVGDVQPGRVDLVRDRVAVGTYTHEPSTSTGADGALAEAGVDCAAPPAAATVGGVAGARCERTDGGVAVAAIDDDRLWVVSLSGDVPGDEAADVIGSLEFVSAEPDS
jgi:hypothetical protein